MIKNNLITILGFKIVWLSCVLGEVYIDSLFGFFIGILFLITFLFFVSNKISAIKIILFFSLIGYLFDSSLSFFKLYTIKAEINFIFLPIWFVVLWPSFCCLFVNVLSFLQNKFFYATVLGAILGPLSYYAGLSLGLANVSNTMVFLLISIFWSLMMFSYSKFFH
jgi:hypothetical protein